MNNKISRGACCCLLVAMPRGYWSIICLSLALASGPAFGQQNAGDVSGEPSAVEEPESGQPQGNVDRPSYPPIRVVIEEPSEAASRAQEREQDADKHDAADLSAQIDAADGAQRSAASAERQEVPTLVLSIIGTIIAVIALIFTIWTALRNDLTTRSQLRAYVHLKDAAVQNYGAGLVPQTAIKLINSGQTPAHDVVVTLRTAFGPKGQENDFEIGTPDKMSVGVLGAGDDINATSSLESVLTPDEIVGINSGQAFLATKGLVTYRDIFGVSRKTEFLLTYHEKAGGFASALAMGADFQSAK